jgi:hypothetical protein
MSPGAPSAGAVGVASGIFNIVKRRPIATRADTFGPRLAHGLRRDFGMCMGLGGVDV